MTCGNSQDQPKAPSCPGNWLSPLLAAHRDHRGAQAPWAGKVAGNKLPSVVGGQPGAGAPVELAGIASLAVRDLLTGPRTDGRVIAAIRGAVLVEFPGSGTGPDSDPRVVAISAADAIRLPNAIIVAGVTSDILAAATRTATDVITEAVVAPAPAGRGPAEAGPAATRIAGPRRTRGGQSRPVCVRAGGGAIRLADLTVAARRWWDPSPVFGPLSRGRLDHGAAILGKVCAQATPGPTMASHLAVKTLAASCASGDLAGAVEQAELLVGLGPGIVPGGDGVLCGMLLALRLLGGAIPGGTRAVWLAGWLSAAVTSYARQRTTPLAASLLSCASRGQAAAEVCAVLHGVAGEEPVEPAARKLLAADPAGPAAGLGAADLAWGLVAGCRAAQVLSVS
jgi:hypothetical protein